MLLGGIACKSAPLALPGVTPLTGAVDLRYRPTPRALYRVGLVREDSIQGQVVFGPAVTEKRVYLTVIVRQSDSAQVRLDMTVDSAMFVLGHTDTKASSVSPGTRLLVSVNERRVRIPDEGAATPNPPLLTQFMPVFLPGPPFPTDTVRPGASWSAHVNYNEPYGPEGVIIPVTVKMKLESVGVREGDTLAVIALDIRGRSRPAAISGSQMSRISVYWKGEEVYSLTRSMTLRAELHGDQAVEPGRMAGFQPPPLSTGVRLSEELLLNP